MRKPLHVDERSPHAAVLNYMISGWVSSLFCHECVTRKISQKHMDMQSVSQYIINGKDYYYGKALEN